MGAGVLFSRQRVIDTFADPDGYNEWNVQDADTIGIFLECDDNRPQVAMSSMRASGYRYRASDIKKALISLSPLRSRRQIGASSMSICGPSMRMGGSRLSWPNSAYETKGCP